MKENFLGRNNDTVRRCELLTTKIRRFLCNSYQLFNR